MNQLLCPSFGLHTLSFVRDSEETFRTIVLPWGGRDGRALGESTRRRPFCPVPPRSAFCHAAPRTGPPVICPYFRFDKVINNKRKFSNITASPRKLLSFIYMFGTILDAILGPSSWPEIVDSFLIGAEIEDDSFVLRAEKVESWFYLLRRCSLSSKRFSHHSSSDIDLGRIALSASWCSLRE